MLYYYWLRSPEIAIARVAARVQSGGHHVPDVDIRRRYARSVENFLELYRIHADTWEVYDNTDGEKKLIAIGSCEKEEIGDRGLWTRFQRSAIHA